MQPIGPLMHEHRLIERMIELMGLEGRRIEQGGDPDVLFLHAAVDFVRTYADACHHGKEEDILFRELGKKDLTVEQKRIMGELVDEHVQGREMVGELAEAVAALARGAGRQEADRAAGVLARLAEFYPAHIEKEDKHFFHPVMEHFSRDEMDRMLEEYAEADRRLLHEHFTALVDAQQRQAGA